LALLSLRAGLTGTTELRLRLSTVRVAVDPDCAVETPLADRVKSMGARALAEAVAGLPDEALPLFLVTSARLLERVPDLMDAIERDSGARLDRKRTRVFPGSPTLFAAAATRALELLRDPVGPPRVLIGAVDSWIDPETIEGLIAMEKVASVATQERPKGAFVPGEAAVFLVLEREDSRGADGASVTPLAWLSAPTAAGDGRTSVGADVMAIALSESLTAHGDALWLLTERNGETWRSRRWGKALMLARSKKQSASIEETTLAPEIGDTGAASLAVGVANAALELSSRSAPLDRALVAALEDTFFATISLEAGPERVAALPPAPEPSRLCRQVARLGAAVLGTASDLRPVRHRIAPRRRGPIERAQAELFAALSRLEQADVGEPSVAALDAARQAAQDFARGARSAERSELRRGREPEPVLARLASVADEIERRLGELRTGAIDEAARRVSTVSILPDETPGPFCSRGLPALYPLEVRRVPAPSLEDATVPELDDDPEEEDLEDELTDEPTSPPDAARPSRSDGLAAECLDTLGRIGQLRAPPPFSRWSTAFGRVDQSIIAHLDLLHGLSAPLALRRAPPLLDDVAVDVSSLLAGRPSAFEPSRAFATTLVLASAHDPRLQRAAVRNAVGAHPELVEPLSDALALASGREISALSEELCLAEDPVGVRIGLEVMGRRRTVSVGAATLRLYDAEPTVRLAAARALAYAAKREPAIQVLSTRLEMEPAPTVAVAIVSALVRLRAPQADLRASKALEDLVALGPTAPLELAEARRGYARICAALGLSNEAMSFASVAFTPADVECLGWFGRVVLVGSLIRLLPQGDDEDPVMARAAARALMRITGAALETTPKGSRLGRGDYVTVPEDSLVLDPRLWNAYWNEVGAELSTGVKYRFGKRADPSTSAREHVADGVRVQDRDLTSLELAIAGVQVADERDWVARQVAALSTFVEK
jgi:hypothetical protein